MKNKPSGVSVVGGVFNWEEFERYFAIQICVLRQVYHAHTTRSDLADDGVMGELCIWGNRFAHGVINLSLRFWCTVLTMERLFQRGENRIFLDLAVNDSVKRIYRGNCVMRRRARLWGSSSYAAPGFVKE